MSFLATTLGLDLAGAIGLYGTLEGPWRNDAPAPLDRLDDVAAPVLGLFGGADGAITADAVAAFDRGLTERGIDHRVVTYPGAPHSFFDRKATDFAARERRRLGRGHLVHRRPLGRLSCPVPHHCRGGDDPGTGAAGLDHDHATVEVAVGGHGDERGLDPRDPRHRIGEGEDRRPGTRQAGPERAGLARRGDHPRQLRVDDRAIRLVEPVDR